MDHSDFSIGLVFYTAAGKWQCTDVGSRTVVAIKLDEKDPSWFRGPPYAVPETAFDENDIAGCVLDPSDLDQGVAP